MTAVPHQRPHVNAGSPPPPVLTAPIIDCEPPLLGTQHCTPPAVLRKRAPRPLHAPAIAGEVPAPTAAVVFTDAALRRVLEVLDRRRPVTQLRGMLAASLLDTAQSLARIPQPGGAAVLRRVRLRSIVSDSAQPVTAAEVFATYSRGPRVRVIAGRVDIVAGRWQLVALQVG